MLMNNTDEQLVNNISTLKSWEILKKEKDAFLVDVRSPEEWQETGIPDLAPINKQTKLITLMFFTPSIHTNEDFIKTLESNFPNKQVKLFFICKAGGRSLKAAKAAQNLGYTNCYNIADGFLGNMFNANSEPLNLNGWINNNLPRRSL